MPKPVGPEADTLSGQAQTRLKSIVDRIESLTEDAGAIKTDLKEVYAEAKGEGFDVKALRKVMRILAADKAKLDEEAAMVDLYLSALGLL